MGKNYDDPLEFILDGEAESVSDGRCTGLTASTKLRKAWQVWTSAVNRELRAWGERRAWRGRSTTSSATAGLLALWMSRTMST